MYKHRAVILWEERTYCSGDCGITGLRVVDFIMKTPDPGFKDLRKMWETLFATLLGNAVIISSEKTERNIEGVVLYDDYDGIRIDDIKEGGEFYYFKGG